MKFPFRESVAVNRPSRAMVKNRPVYQPHWMQVEAIKLQGIVC